MNQPEIKNHFSPSEKCKSPKGKKPAKQEFMDDCDLNNIMRKFQKTGTLDHVKQYQGQYGETSPHTLHESMTIVREAENMFADLPSSIRQEFQNEPLRFLEFVQDPANRDRADELGLTLSDAAEAAAIAEGTRPEVDSEAGQDAQPAEGSEETT